MLWQPGLHLIQASVRLPGYRNRLVYRCHNCRVTLAAQPFPLSPAGVVLGFSLNWVVLMNLRRLETRFWTNWKLEVSQVRLGCLQQLEDSGRSAGVQEIVLMRVLQTGSDTLCIDTANLPVWIPKFLWLLLLFCKFLLFGQIIQNGSSSPQSNSDDMGSYRKNYLSENPNSTSDAGHGQSP